jgi:hypothetical protein
MYTNAEKSTAAIFTKRRHPLRNRVKLFETEILWSTMAKYLGVHMVKGLTWNTHVKAMTTKAMRHCQTLYSVFGCRTLNRTKRTDVYKYVIRSIFLYGAPACGYAAKNNRQKLQTVQNKILRTVFVGERYTCNTTMHTTLNIRTVYEEIEKASAKLHKHISSYGSPIIAAVGSYDTHMLCI